MGDIFDFLKAGSISSHFIPLDQLGVIYSIGLKETIELLYAKLRVTVEVVI
ncbi:MAG: hypothetical protein PHO08_19095 [Methylococcales bacterium]|nr:hypothetical protein [Methylococcales bacterium]